MMTLIGCHVFWDTIDSWVLGGGDITAELNPGR